jgi:hypothetical protein
LGPVPIVGPVRVVDPVRVVGARYGAELVPPRRRPLR